MDTRMIRVLKVISPASCVVCELGRYNHAQGIHDQ